MLCYVTYADFRPFGEDDINWPLAAYRVVRTNQTIKPFEKLLEIKQHE